jgi:beta propeller repeat protein
VWTGIGAAGRPAVFLCEIDASTGGCAERELAPGGETRVAPAIDGDRVVWSEVFDLATCQLDAATGACARQPLGLFDPFAGLVDLPAVSGNLIAWLEFSHDFGRSDLRVCELDPASGACPVIALSTSGSAWRPAISGRRVVWHENSPGPDIDILFCEYDRETRSCPVQRLTSNPFDQRSPAIDGDRVVWDDDRNGGLREVFGFDLPHLDPIDERRVREGETLVVEVAGRDPLGDPVALSARRANGEALETVGAVFRDLGTGRGELHWQPDFDQAGSRAFHVELTTLGLLRTRRTLRVHVEDVNRAPQVVVERFSVAARGQPLRIDACASADPDGDPLDFRWLDGDGSPLGAKCALTLPPRERSGLRRITLEVSDGVDARDARVFALWLPSRAAAHRGL